MTFIGNLALIVLGLVGVSLAVLMAMVWPLRTSAALLGLAGAWVGTELFHGTVLGTALGLGAGLVSWFVLYGVFTGLAQFWSQLKSTQAQLHARLEKYSHRNRYARLLHETVGKNVTASMVVLAAIATIGYWLLLALKTAR